jgi:hypothetical protein
LFPFFWKNSNDISIIKLYVNVIKTVIIIWKAVVKWISRDGFEDGKRQGVSDYQNGRSFDDDCYGDNAL